MNGRGLRVWANLGGLVFVVLMVAGAMLLFDGPQGSSPAKMAAYYGSSSNRTHLNVGWLLAGLGLFFLVWFVAALREHVAAGERTRPEDGSLLSTIVTIGGASSIAVTMAAIAVSSGVKTMSDDTYHHQVYSGIIHAAGDATYVMVVTGAAGMAALIFATTSAVFSYGFLPRWVGWFGVVAGVAAIISLFFFTMLVWLLWIAVTSVMLYLRARSSRVEAPHTAAAAA